MFGWISSVVFCSVLFQLRRDSSVLVPELFRIGTEWCGTLYPAFSTVPRQVAVWGSPHQGLEPEFRDIPCRSRLTEGPYQAPPPHSVRPPFRLGFAVQAL